MSVDCTQCPLRKLSQFESFTKGELAFMQQFKVGELIVDAGTPILQEGSNTPQLYTALQGMGLRYKLLENGARQVVNFVLPGDFIGLQAGVMGEMKHSVEAVTAMTLCVFDRKGLWGLFKNQPERAYDLTWFASIEEYFLSDAIASIGQMTAEQRMCWGLLRFHGRCEGLELNDGDNCPFPFRQTDLADALGLSPEYTSRVLSKLRRDMVLDLRDGTLLILNRPECERRAMHHVDVPETRPLI